jgi:NAD(P)-dependent dehydrogenase (short-subunit alcohol dehydrogenase family)
VLADRVAVVYGAGAIGAAVAGAFAAEGATVHLASRTEEKVAAVAERIRAAGGAVETAVLDATDEEAVDRHADAVVTASGRLDVSINLISHGYVQGAPLVELPVDDVLGPVLTALRSTLLTARAAARHMTRQGSGVILVFGGYGDPVPNVGGLQVGLNAVEALRRGLAAELGPHGVRVLTIQTGGIPESVPASLGAVRDEIERATVARTMLGRAATLADVGAVAAFAASDRARAMTCGALNISAGAIVG